VLLFVVETVVVKPFNRYCLVLGHCCNCLDQGQYLCFDRGHLSHSETLPDLLSLSEERLSLCSLSQRERLSFHISFYEMLNLNIRRPSAFLSNFRSRYMHRDYE
jgi:hypothetical protein